MTDDIIQEEDVPTEEVPLDDLYDVILEEEIDEDIPEFDKDELELDETD